MGKLESALFYLQTALDIEQLLIPNTLDLADSFSNDDLGLGGDVCSVFS
jgi:hypothetical protein